MMNPHCTGLDAVTTVKGATNTVVFLAYVEQAVVLTLGADAIVVIDTFGVDKVSGIRTTSEVVKA
ncbi:hypothetical protein [Noviherbaspirillum suwonense]|nr:hypothetical protein [Noviherbaspirillum suwonense]